MDFFWKCMAIFVGRDHLPHYIIYITNQQSRLNLKVAIELIKGAIRLFLQFHICWNFKSETYIAYVICCLTKFNLNDENKNNLNVK